ncbi:MAG: 4-hydroxy-3-methylbut-2-enyl diphosphate reductase [Actinomycetota bacterium]
MEITVARYAGFCPGVRRAIRMAREVLEDRERPAFSLGPVIHNPQVVEELEGRGLRVLPDDPGGWDPEVLRGARVVIRSHGIPPSLAQMLTGLGAELVDATCPTVKKAQKAAMRLVGEGYHLFVIGNREHPEVEAILGHVNREAVVIKEIGELKEWWEGQTRMVRKVGLIAQTTIDLLTFRSLVEGLITEVPEMIREVSEMKLINTLCRNTLARQAEALQLALAHDLVVVVGGRNSSNTEFLRKICQTAGALTLKVETAAELDCSVLGEATRVAVVGGASTPRDRVEEVRRYLAGL